MEDLETTWNETRPMHVPFTFIYFSSFLILDPSPTPHFYQQILLWQNSKTAFGLRAPLRYFCLAVWNPRMQNDLRALTLQHNVILSTNSVSCQSETMSPVNCSCMPQKLHCRVKTSRGQWVVERQQIACQDYSILFLIYPRGIQWRDMLKKKAPNSWSLCGVMNQPRKGWKTPCRGFTD